MQTYVRKIGNSAGVIISAGLLKKYGLREGSEVVITEQEGGIVITPLHNKPKFRLSELLAKCDENAPQVTELEGWNNAASVGEEI